MSEHLDLTNCNTREEKMFRAMDVAIQWIDDGAIDIAREVLAEVYCPIYNEELEKLDEGEPTLINQFLTYPPIMICCLK